MMSAKYAVCHVDCEYTPIPDNGALVCKPEIVRETEKAVCYKSGGQNVWIPRTVIKSEGVSPYGWYIEVPFWIAKEKGLDTSRPTVPMVY
jgi:hypothetical protein